MKKQDPILTDIGISSPISNIQYPISNIQYPISNIQYHTTLESKQLFPPPTNRLKPFYSFPYCLLLSLSLSVLGLFLPACAPLSDSENPPAKLPDISLSNTLYAPHFIYFEITVNKAIDTNLEVGFLIGTDAVVPQNPENNQGYISRTFSSSNKKRQVFLFMHDTTGYTNSDVENTFDSSDFLQVDTNYYLHIVNSSLTTSPQAFTTMSYETLNAIGNPVTALNGLASTDPVAITGIIERKADEPTIFPSVIFGSGYRAATIRQGTTDIILCTYTAQTCYPSFAGLKDYRHYRSAVDYITLLIAPNARTGSGTWSVVTTSSTYYLQINTITE
ncbi:hypothetical protein P0082_07320 [Candidatus Haliotispira prima]|uniref:DUF4397 domain-containing protein n=1 Tax=Candidatus Haliotispira prima TaxID=3034016 RepID=A0ABY8MFG4_9SPIO|nr:hypothetical protein P0082_07320 [Candidatus Haliotispira prima]